MKLCFLYLLEYFELYLFQFTQNWSSLHFQIVQKRERNFYDVIIFEIIITQLGKTINDKYSNPGNFVITAM